MASRFRPRFWGNFGIIPTLEVPADCFGAVLAEAAGECRFVPAQAARFWRIASLKSDPEPGYGMDVPEYVIRHQTEFCSRRDHKLRLFAVVGVINCHSMLIQTTGLEYGLKD